MKLLALALRAVAALALVLVAGCATGPDGRRHYVGPSMAASLGFDRFSVGLTLLGDPAVKLPPPSGK